MFSRFQLLQINFLCLTLCKIIKIETLSETTTHTLTIYSILYKEHLQSDYLIIDLL